MENSKTSYLTLSIWIHFIRFFLLSLFSHLPFPLIYVFLTLPLDNNVDDYVPIQLAAASTKQHTENSTVGMNVNINQALCKSVDNVNWLIRRDYQHSKTNAGEQLKNLKQRPECCESWKYFSIFPNNRRELRVVAYPILPMFAHL